MRDPVVIPESPSGDAQDRAPSAHTPGPWAYCMRPSWMWHVKGPGKAVCFTSANYSPAGRATNEANARLIAAAPDLLIACRLALNAFERNDAIDWNVLSEAIAKAEGRS